VHIIATMTTLPSRINFLAPVIEAVLNQTIAVSSLELNVPIFCERTKEVYTIPDWLNSINKVTVFRTEDWGPITKIAPTLIRHKLDNELYLWSIDDDFAYPPNQLELLVSAHDKEKKRILTRHGGYFAENGDITFTYGAGPVHMLEGFGGVLYPPDCISDDFESYVRTTCQNEDCRMSDDLVLSYYFRKHNVEIYLYNKPSDTIPFIPTGFQSYAAVDALSRQNGGHKVRYRRVQKLLNDSAFRLDV
jgi:hypothetical protein